jgi:DNA-binding CsgD family transcriptional regulator
MTLIINEGDIVSLHKHPTGLFSKNVSELLEPLKQSLDITHFSHTRIFSSGNHSYLTNHPEFAEDFIAEECYKIGFVSDPKNYHSGYYLLDTLPPNKVTDLLHERYGMGHVLMIVRKFETHSENFYFGTSSDNTQMSNVYLNHRSTFDAFIDYFKEYAADLIQEADASRLQYPANHCQETLLTQHFDPWPVEFLTTIPFTTKERECAFYLAQCLSLRETSDRMGISPRTLEKHVAKLKAKLGCKNMSSLVVKLRGLL